MADTPETSKAEATPSEERDLMGSAPGPQVPDSASEESVREYRPPAASPRAFPRFLRAALLAVLGISFIGAALLSGYPLVAPGHSTGVDVWPHMVRQKIVYESLKTGTSPFWSFKFYAGYPHLRYYGPLLALLGGLLALPLGGNQFLAMKLLLFVLHLGSGVTMYWYLAALTRRRLAAALGAIVYLLIPWRVLFIAAGGNYPLALMYLLVPVCFLAFERLNTGAGSRYALLLGAGFGLAVLSHIVYALYLAALLCLAFTGRIVMSWRFPAHGRRLAARLGIAFLSGLGLTAFFTIPFLVEFRNHLFPQVDVGLTRPGLAALLLPWAEPGNSSGAYFGLSVLLLLAVSAGLLLTSTRHRRQAIGLLAGSVLIVGFSIAAPNMGAIGRTLACGLPPVRFLVFFVFLAAVLVAVGCAVMESRLSSTARTICFLVITGVVAADCLNLIMRIQLMSREQVLLSRSLVYETLGNQWPARALDVNVPADRVDDVRRTLRLPASGYLFGDLASPFGPPYHQFAPRSLLYVYPWTNFVAADLGNPDSSSLCGTSMKALALLGVSHVVTLPALVTSEGTDSTVLFLVKKGIAWDDRLLVSGEQPPLLIGPTRVELVLASDVIRPMRPERVVQNRTFCVADDWQACLDSIKVDSGLRRLSFIPVTEGQRAESLPATPDLAVLGTMVRNDRVSITLRTGQECFLRLALSYYPELSVRLDGRPVEFEETKDHFTWLRCPAGRHTILVTAPLSPLRRTMLAVSALALLGTIALAVLPRRRRIRPGS